MSGNQVRALCWAGMVVMAAMDWPLAGVGLTLALLQFSEG